MGRGDEGIAPYRNAGRPQHVGATLVVARPAGRTSVGADAHIRPLPRGSRTDTLGDRTETGGHNGRPYRVAEVHADGLGANYAKGAREAALGRRPLC